MREEQDEEDEGDGPFIRITIPTRNNSHYLQFNEHILFYNMVLRLQSGYWV